MQRHVLEAGLHATPAGSRQQQQQQRRPSTGVQLASAGIGLSVSLESTIGRVPPWGGRHCNAASCASQSSGGGGGDAGKPSHAVQRASSCCLEATRRAAPDAAPLAHVALADNSAGAAAVGSTAGPRQSAVDIAAWRTKAEPGVAPQVASASAAAADGQGAGSGRWPPTPPRPCVTAATPSLMLQSPSNFRLPASRAPLQPAAGNGVLVPGVLPSPPPAAGSRKQAGLLLKAARLGLLR